MLVQMDETRIQTIEDIAVFLVYLPGMVEIPRL